MSEASIEPAEFLVFAERLADAAGAVITPYFRSRIAIDQKADASPVTIADREAEQAMRALIEETFPEHGIEGEEFGAVRLDADYVWHLDPIDGTKSFITGRPLFGTLVSVAHRGRPVVGVIDHCILDERWTGAAGMTSRWNGDDIAVRSCPSLGEAVLYVTSPRMFQKPGEAEGYRRVEDAVALPMYGGDCYAYGQLAMGFADIIVEADLDTHDYLALIPVIEGAGGIITDWEGRALDPDSDGRIVAAGDKRVHAEALALLKIG
ncbi:MAG: histidinol-phosphatase [Alphaproteobacteria bacterium]|nr:histidinol-phosphatase [Alphaproteobacteria bacterium]